MAVKHPSVRKRVVYAEDVNYRGTVYARVEITVGVTDRRLTRDEHSNLVEEIASNAMQTLASARHINQPLSKVKITR
jgi:hypothetical protein